MRPLFSIVQNTTDLSDHLNEKLPPLQEGVDDEVKVDQLLSLLSQKMTIVMIMKLRLITSQYSLTNATYCAGTDETLPINLQLQRQ